MTGNEPGRDGALGEPHAARVGLTYSPPRGPWNIARSKALSVGLSDAYFKSLGLPSLIEAR